MATPVDLTGYHLTFDAEMTSSADMSKFSNTFSNGDRTLWPNGELERYVDYNAADPNNPFAFSNGALTITARPNGVGNLPYTSGLLQTSDSFSQSEGYVEIRAQVPAGQGFWSAFWMLPKGAYWPEIDILEQPNNSGSSTVYWNHINTDTDNSGGFQETGVNLSAGYHSYGFKWDGYSLQFTFDGNLVGYPHLTPPSLAGKQMYLLANLAVGGPGTWVGPPAPGTSASLNIDYIRAYSKDPSAPAVTMEPISSSDGANTNPGLPSTATVGTPTVRLAHDTGASSTDHLTSDPTLSVMAGQSGDTFVYALDGSGNSAMAPQLPRDGTADGSHVVSVVETDAAGHTSAPVSLSFILDTRAPSAPVVTLTHDTGSSSTDRVTSDASLSVAQTEPGSGFTYSVDGTIVPNYDPAQLSLGQHTIGVTQTDAAGNLSAAGSISFTLASATSAPSTSDPSTGSAASGSSSGGTAGSGGKLCNHDHWPKHLSADREHIRLVDE